MEIITELKMKLEYILINFNFFVAKNKKYDMLRQD